MQLKKGFGKKHIHIIDIFFIVLIMIICLWNLESIDRIRVVDEFGYWGVAAAFIGWDWNELLATTPYYSFGFSFVLMPLLLVAKLGIPMAIIYKMSIVMNALFLVGIYILVQYVEKEIAPQLPGFLKSAIALMVTLYVGNTVQMDTLWTEVYLCFMFWCIIATLIRVLKKPGYRNTSLLLILSANIFATHMRAIGIAASVGGVLLIYILTHFKELSKKYIIFIFGTVAVLILIFFGIKLYVTDTIYFNSYAAQATNSVDTVKAFSSNSVNDLSSNIKKVRMLFEPAGLLDVLMSSCGKMFYVFSATFLLGAVGVIMAIVQLISCFIKKLKKEFVPKWDLMQWYSLFVLLAFMGEILVSAIFKCMPVYTDGPLYLYSTEAIVFGRYADFVVGGIMLCGIYGIYYMRKYYKEIIVAAICFILLSMNVQHQFDILTANMGNSDIVHFRLNQNAWFAFLAGENKDINYFSYYAAIVSLGAFLLIFATRLMEKKKINALAVTLTVISIAWGVLGIYYADEFNSSKKYRDEHVDALASIIEITDKDTPIYWITENYTDGSDTCMKVLQWALGNRSVRARIINDLEAINVEHAVMICHSDNEIVNDILQMKAELIYESGILNVYIEKKNTRYDELKEKAYEISYEKTKE